MGQDSVPIFGSHAWYVFFLYRLLALTSEGFTHPATDDIPMSFMDDYSDTELWTPYYGETLRIDHAHAPNYPHCPGYVVSCFRQLSKLCVILNDVLQEIYSPETTARREEESPVEAKAASEEPFVRISRDLRDWLVCLPPHLRITPNQMPSLAPPVHIMSLNLLYHTTVILLYRPVVLGASDIGQAGPARAYQTCLQATAAIHDLLILQSNTFGLSIISYLNVYCAYIAATIAIVRHEQEAKLGEDCATSAERTGLSFLLEVMDRSSAGMPGFVKSSSVIRKRMVAVTSQQNGDHSHLPISSSMQYHGSAGIDGDVITQQDFQQRFDPTYSRSYSCTDTSGTFVAPMQWQSGLRSSLCAESSSMAEDYLPAFPGQRFPVGSEHSVDSSDVDSQAQSVLMSYNLDPRPRLNPCDIDWHLVGTFEGSTAHMNSM